MQSEQSPTERSPSPRDISQEFLAMETFEFLDFLRMLKNEPVLNITIDWKDVPTARRLKAFLEDFNAIERGQKRTATIRATEEQRRQEPNVFSSGVRWEQVKTG